MKPKMELPPINLKTQNQLIIAFSHLTENISRLVFAVV